MSKRGTRSSNTIREYMAAEERLIDIFSPLPGSEVATTASENTIVTPNAATGDSLLQPDIDPSRDSMLAFISEDSEIHSLLSSSETSGFKGFDDECVNFHETAEDIKNMGMQSLIFGVFRSADNVGRSSTHNFLDCLEPKAAHNVDQIGDSSAAPLESNTSDGYMLTNGTEPQSLSADQLVIDEQNVIEVQSECVIYDDENLMLVTQEQCCEIIVATDDVHTEQDMDRAYLMNLQPLEEEQQELNNGISYGSDQLPTGEEEPGGEAHVYLSDAAIVEQQQLLIDAAEEEVQHVSDSFVDERPDICEVYDHELEEHDDECAEEMHLEQEQPAIVISSEIVEVVEVVEEVEEKEQPKAAPAAVIPYSSTTEFPVSSTSRPHGSDEDLEDEQGAAVRPSKPKQRKYIKNTLSTESMDRHLATICQSQPQMSLSEKMSNWNYTNNCEAVEDVENFESVFEQHEAEPTQVKFGEFYNTLQQSCTKLDECTNQNSSGGVAKDAQDTPHSSEDMAMPKRPSYRRLLHATPTEQTEHILLEDEDDDDGFEVNVNASQNTLVPEPMEPNQKTMETQTVLPVLVASKETSTTDLVNRTSPQVTKACEIFIETDPETMQYPAEDKEQDVTTKDAENVQEECMLNANVSINEQPEEHATEPTEATEARSNSLENPTEAQFYEQHEFCNYLGLTEMATANAVATAMRELANSTIARRSLRVRTQQQLDRMRSDARGKRRDRKQYNKQDQEQEEGQKAMEDHYMSDTSSINSNHATNAAGTNKNTTMMDNDLVTGTGIGTATATVTATTTLNSVEESSKTAFLYQMPSMMNASQTQPFECFYRNDGGHQQQNANDFRGTSDYHRLSLEAAFAKVYAAAAPAQNELHESMQNRLRQSRETKPSIYIVKALNNSAPNAGETLAHTSPERPNYRKSPERQKHNESPDRLHYNKSPDATNPVKKTKKPPKKKLDKRRRTTAGALTMTVQPERDLVTRSTTHMNSKLLRNRKINLLKSYELSDVVSQARSRQRLSAGSAVVAKRLNTPKAVKKARKKSEPTKSVQSTQQSAVEQKQKTAKSKISKMARGHAEQQAEPKVDMKGAKRKRMRTKSMPMEQTAELQPSDIGDSLVAPFASEMESNSMQLEPPKPPMDTHEFITTQSIVSPPLYSAAVRRYFSSVCKSKAQNLPELSYQDQQDNQYQQRHEPPAQRYQLRHKHDQKRHHPYVEQQQQQQQPQQQQQQQQDQMQHQYEESEDVDALFDIPVSYAHLSMPALIYPPLSPPTSQRTPHFSRRTRQTAGSTAEEEILPNTQMTHAGGLLSLTKGSTTLRNPLAGKNGKVLYMYYELEQLIVVQEKFISYWKYSKVFNILHKPNTESTQMTAAQHYVYNILGKNLNQNLNLNQIPNPSPTRKSTESNKSDVNDDLRWVSLSGTRRITNDIEIIAPYCNRLCAHNSTPVYIEMRSHLLDHHKRETKLLSLYVNVYYYCEEEMRPKVHSVHLDSVNCDPEEVIFTSIADSRYFVMAWQQELVIGKPRAGICKYSLTPTLDTLASIREFKQLRHELRHIECLTEDRLIGYGLTRITIWDHRSGDTLMNYDFGFSLGTNLGIMHFSSFDIDQSSILVLYQHVKEPNQWPELRIMACELSHVTPSHRLIHVHRLPSPQFDSNLIAVNTGDHVILKAPTDDEIWVSITDPRQLTYLAPQGNQRFYTPQKSQLILATQQTLNVDSISNHVLKLATQQQNTLLLAAAEVAVTPGPHLAESV